MLDVCLLGTAGMMPLPHRWLTASLMRYNGSSLLIDCGEGTQIAIKEKGWTFKPIDVICFYTLSCGSYQRTAGIASFHGQCRADRTSDYDWTKGIRACSRGTSDDCTGTAV